MIGDDWLLVLSSGKKKVAIYLYKGTNMHVIRQKTIVEIFSTSRQFEQHKLVCMVAAITVKHIAITKIALH